jgi:putative SOS response-associated peptidase YedK
MPVILDSDTYDLWLDLGVRDVSEASELLKLYDARLRRCYPVSNRLAANKQSWGTIATHEHSLTGN